MSKIIKNYRAHNNTSGSC